MAENKKYYYLKLKDTFFDSEEMKILESMDNGILYQNLYLKICLISLKSNGALLFKDMIPYNLDMIATITRINKDIVKTGLTVFKELGLITIADNETIYMSDIQTLIGKSSTESDRVSKYKKKLDTITKIEEEEASNNFVENQENDCSNFVEEQEEICNNSVEKLQKSYGSVTPEKEIEKELELEREIERDVNNTTHEKIEDFKSPYGLLNYSHWDWNSFQNAYLFWYIKITGKPVSRLEQTVSAKGENLEKLKWLENNFLNRVVNAGVAIFETLEFIAKDESCKANINFRASNYLNGVISRLVDYELAKTDNIKNEGIGKYKNPTFDYFKY